MLANQGLLRRDGRHPRGGRPPLARRSRLEVPAGVQDPLGKGLRNERHADAAEGAEETQVTEEGEVEANPVARDENGKLMFSDDETVNDDGTVKGTFRAGDKTKAENNRYGYINYTANVTKKCVNDEIGRNDIYKL